jgi:hypothetical protein
LTPKFGVAIATKRSKILYHKELQANWQIGLETVGDGLGGIQTKKNPPACG